MKKTRLKQLTKLVNSKDYRDREEAARASDLPLELQKILVRDEDFSVRSYVARNKKLVNGKLQQILAKDKSTSVRLNLTENPSFTDRKLWELLRNDEYTWISNTINKRIEEKKTGLNVSEIKLIKDAAYNQALQDVLNILKEMETTKEQHLNAFDMMQYYHNCNYIRFNNCTLYGKILTLKK